MRSMGKTMFLDIETVPTEAALRHEIEHTGSSQPGEAGVPDEKIVKKLSLSGAGGRIVCLAYAIEPPQDAPVEAVSGEETDIVATFWEKAKGVTLFVGHNVLDFDLRFIWQRSIVLGIKPSVEISFVRFRSSPVFDTMREWTKWGRDFVSLDELARVFGLPSSKTEMDGSRVFASYQRSELAEIVEYCKTDVQLVRKIYRRIVFNTGE